MKVLENTATVPHTRERILKDIKTVDQAVKAEKDVETGYYSVISENLSYWIAVEEDIVESYARLIAETSNPIIKFTLSQIVEDSKRHKQILSSALESLTPVLNDEKRHTRLLQKLSSKIREV